MARFDDPELAATYVGAEHFRQQALRRLGSLFSPDGMVWASPFADELHRRFVEAPDTSADSFENKLRKQLAGANPGAIQLMAELLFAHQLMARDIRGTTKRKNITTVLSWMPDPPEIPSDLDAALDGGFATAGMGFRSRRPTQITYLIEFTRQWVTLDPEIRDRLLDDDPWAFKDFVYGIESEGSPESQRNALLYLVHPETFEDIVSQYHKRAIVDAFGELAPGIADVDRALLEIRNRIESEIHEVARFYKEPLESRWRNTDEAEAELLDAGPREARAWLVRSGRSSDSHIEEWLVNGYCAIGWVDAGIVEPGEGRKQIVAQLEDAFPDQPKGWVRSSAGNLHRFLNQVAPGDIVVSPDGQKVYIGVVTSDPYWVDGQVQPRRRSVDWTNVEAPISRDQLSESAYSKMRTLLTVSDISGDFAEFARIAGLDVKPQVVTEIAATADIGPLALSRVAKDFAHKLHVPAEWLNDIIDLLEDKRQVIFYGPPGTGKTYLAQQLADYLTESDGSTLVQFHPSYAYEDFFEGFRPQESMNGTGITFELVPGPLRRIADAAREDRTRPYLLIIDEINRANLAKVFGELYFLLEYRDRTISLQYGGESEFSLPKNLFVIGTMNTADRSIAFVDAAMRRRFYFIPFFPRSHPVDQVLSRWLQAQNRDDRPAALLRELNDRIDDDDFAVGPSYFMTDRSQSDPGLRRIWNHAILPLLEEHFFGTGRDVDGEFGFDAITNATKPESSNDPGIGEASITEAE